MARMQSSSAPRQPRLLLGALLLLGSCAAAAVAAERAAPAPLRTVSDDLGNSVAVGRAPLRIVSLTPGATEMLFAAGAGSQLIATVEYSSEPPAARAVPRIGDVAAIDIERLVALRPEVVIAWPAGGNPAQRAKIAALEMRLAALERTYGGAHGAARPSVLLQVWNRPIYTIGGRHLMSDALALCGARNVFADLPEPGPLVDTEAVIARNPDIILAAAPPGEGAAWVADWQRFPGLAAVRNHRVVAFENQGLSRLGPSVLDATEDLCRTIARLSRGSS